MGKVIGDRGRFGEVYITFSTMQKDLDCERG
jgi:hypothetical protein